MVLCAGSRIRGRQIVQMNKSEFQENYKNRYFAGVPRIVMLLLFLCDNFLGIRSFSLVWLMLG